MATRLLAFPLKPFSPPPSLFFLSQRFKIPFSSPPRSQFCKFVAYAHAESASKSNFDVDFARESEKEELSWEKFNALIQAHCSKGHLDEPLDLLARMEVLGMRPSHSSYTRLIDALGRVGRTLEADAVFQEMRRFGLRPGPAHYNSLLGAFLRKGQLHLADHLLVEMHERGVARKKETFLLLLDSYAHAGRLEDSWWVPGTRGPPIYLPQLPSRTGEADRSDRSKRGKERASPNAEMEAERVPGTRGPPIYLPRLASHTGEVAQAWTGARGEKRELEQEEGSEQGGRRSLGKEAAGT